MHRLGRPEERYPDAARLGGHGEAPQLVVTRMRQPDSERMAARGTQHLLCSPERIAPPPDLHQRELREIDAGGGERRRVWQIRRREPDDALARPGKRGERGQHELQLADACSSDQKLGQDAGWPAAAGKLAVERCEAGGRGRCTGRQPSAAPDWMPLENVFQRRHALY